MTMAKNLRDQLIARIRGGGRGTVYTNKDFLDLGNRPAVDRVLSQLADEGVFKRLQRGLYYYTKSNPLLGIELSADPDEIANAVARQTGHRSEPSGAMAANALGLTTQVPAKQVYLTDGPSKTVHIGGQIIVLKHETPKGITPRTKMSRLVFQALRYLGKEAIDDTVITKLRTVLSDNDKQQLLRDAPYMTDWIVYVVQQIVNREE
jgi:hypothetical protein